MQLKTQRKANLSSKLSVTHRFQRFSTKKLKLHSQLAAFSKRDQPTHPRARKYLTTHKSVHFTPPTLQRTMVSNLQEQTEAIAKQFASCIRIGSIVRLNGQVGAGKSVFARSVIQTLTDKPHIRVPSPTFLLDLTYPFTTSDNKRAT